MADMTRAKFYGVSKARMAKRSTRLMIRIRDDVGKLAVLWGDVDEAINQAADRACADIEEQLATSLARLDEVLDDL